MLLLEYKEEVLKEELEALHEILLYSLVSVEHWWVLPWIECVNWANVSLRVVLVGAAV